MVSAGRLAGRRVVVTGAARGMGRSHAVAAAAHGAALALLDVEAAGAELAETARLAGEYGGAVATGTADVRDARALDAAVDACAGALGGLDGLVANAGVATSAAPTWLTSAEEWDRVLAVNLTGTFHTVRAVVPHLVAAGAGGAVVLVASTAAARPLPLAASYNASKAGVVALGRTLAQELGPLGIRCNTVLPGSVETPMTDELAAAAGLTREQVLGGLLPQQLLRRVIQPGEVTDAVLYLLGDGAASVTGTELRVDAGLTQRNAAIPDGVIGVIEGICRLGVGPRADFSPPAT